VTSPVLADSLPVLAQLSFAREISSTRNIWSTPSYMSFCICMITRYSTWIRVTYDTMRAVRYVCSHTSKRSQVSYILFTRFVRTVEWRLLLCTRDSAWKILLLKATPGPGTRVWCGTVYMLGLILPSSRRVSEDVRCNPSWLTLIVMTKSRRSER